MVVEIEGKGKEEEKERKARNLSKPFCDVP